MEYLGEYVSMKICWYMHKDKMNEINREYKEVLDWDHDSDDISLMRINKVYYNFRDPRKYSKVIDMIGVIPLDIELLFKIITRRTSLSCSGLELSGNMWFLPKNYFMSSGSHNLYKFQS